jgi:two-component system, sensor histidine kinase and response regulator
MNDAVTILIVDDRPENIFALEKLLEKPSRTFVTANSGKEGLTLALNNNIDLVILDVQMPEMDGFEVAQILKSSKRTKDVPIIFASAEKKERQSIMKGFEEGAVDYLPKPLDPELTKAKVSVLLKIQLQKRELAEKNKSLEKAEVEILQLNSELQKNNEQLLTVNKDLESFSYSVSHDLRAPLRSIIGYSKALEEDYHEKLDADGKRQLSIIQQNAIRMNTLIDNLLEFSKLGKKELEKSEVDTGSLVQNVINEVKNSRNYTTKVNVSALPTVHGDPTLLTQVWVNLISNAFKYSSKKEAPVVEVGSKEETGETLFYVKDNGAGFDMAYANKLFGVFQRLHKVDEFEGTGIGLSLVKRIINRHGGRIWAEAAPGKGATFYFTLPNS